MRSRFIRASCALALAVIAIAGAGACKKAAGPTPDCNNFTRDGNETDIDCGGPICPACNSGMSCKLDRDCQSKLCTSDDKCSAPTCSDGLENGSETDVDCGGPDCMPCASGKGCAAGDDCQSSSCDFDAGICG